MNTVSLLLLPLASAGVIAASPTLLPPGTEAQLAAVLERIDAGNAQAPVQAAPVIPAAAASATTAAAPSSAGTAARGLGSGSLQPASGLHSAARGLSSAEEWQRQFPRYTRR